MAESLEVKIGKIETTLEHIQKQLDNIEEKVNITSDKSNEYVKKDDPSYFYKNMTKYNAETLNKRVNWIVLLDGLFKLLVIVLGVLVVISK